MPTNEHYFVEENKDGKFAIRAKNSKRASLLVDTQEEAIRRVNKFNAQDHPDVARVRETGKGAPDKWRPAKR